MSSATSAVTGAASGVSSATSAVTGATTAVTGGNSGATAVVTGTTSAVTSSVADVASGVTGAIPTMASAVSAETLALHGTMATASGDRRFTAWSPAGLVERRESIVDWPAVALRARGQISQPLEGDICPVADGVICSMTAGVSNPDSLAEVAAAVIRFLAITGFGTPLLLVALLALTVTGASAVAGARRRTIGHRAGPQRGAGARGDAQTEGCLGVSLIPAVAIPRIRSRPTNRLRRIRLHAGGRRTDPSASTMPEASAKRRLDELDDRTIFREVAARAGRGLRHPDDFRGPIRRRRRRLRS